MPQARDEAGNIWETDAQGNPVRLVQAAGQAPQMPADPKFPYEGPKAAADLQGAQVNTEGNRIDNSVKGATAPAIITKAEADAKKAVADAKAAEAAAEEAIKKGKGPDIDALNAARADVLRRLELVRTLRERSNEWFATGIGSNVARMFDGTTATDVNADVNTLSGAGALQTIMDMSAANGGKNPLTPLSEGDVRMIRESVTNLDPSQSDVNFRKNLGTHEDIYSRALRVADQQLTDLGAAPAAQGGSSGQGGGTPPPGFNGGAPAYQKAQGKYYSTPDDMRVSNAVYGAMGGGLSAMVEAARANGYEPAPNEVAAWRKSMDEGERRGLRPGLTPLTRGTRGQVAQQFGDMAASPAGSFGIGAANTVAMGGLDEITGALNSIGSGNSMADEIAYADFGKRASSEANPASYLGGQLFGGFTQGLAALKATPGLFGSIGSSVPRIAGAGAAYGGTEGALEGNADRFTGAAEGAGVGALGGVAGAKVVAPLAELAMRSKGGQLLSEGVRDAVNRFRPGTLEATGGVPAFATGERALPRFDQADMAGPINNLRDADRLGLPYALADADPHLRMLAGSVARKSPDARQLAEDTFEPRYRGQAERAYDAIDTRLAPVTDIAERSGQWRQAAQTASAPYYAAASGNPVDGRIAPFLQTPSGRAALKDAHDIALDDGVDPQSLGLLVDDAGIVRLHPGPVKEEQAAAKARNDFNDAQEAYRTARNRPGANVDSARSAMSKARSRLTAAEKRLAEAPVEASQMQARMPSLRTMDYFKRGIDQQLNQYRNPMTGNLDLEGNPAAQALVGFQKRFLDTLDNINPDYKAARGAYAGEIKNRTALERGAKAPAMNVKPRDLPRMTEGMDDTGLGEFRRGYATTLGDNVNDVRLGANPYERVYGTPNQQAKIDATFPGAPDFARQYGLERDMTKTFTETLGGSQTAPRQAADQIFEGPGMTALDAGTQLATGGGFSPVSALRLTGRMLGDNAKLGMGQKKADALAPVLFNNDPRAVLDYLDSLGQRQLKDATRKTAFKRRSGLFGAVAAPTVFLGSE